LRTRVPGRHRGRRLHCRDPGVSLSPWRCSPRTPELGLAARRTGAPRVQRRRS
jgi:hypothetical protein